MPAVTIPEWHEASYDAAEVVNLRAIAELSGAPQYAALRSYSTGRREHALYGPMPAPVVRIANRRLWLKRDVEEWLMVPIPRWRRSKTTIAEWVAQGRPRRPDTDETDSSERPCTETADVAPEPPGDAATMPVSHDGHLPTAP